MKNDDIHSIDDLVASDSFRKWIIEKDETEAVFWNKWIEDNPGHIEWVATARAMVSVLIENERHLPEAEIDRQAELIRQRILANDTATDYNNEEPSILPAKKRSLLNPLKYAAAVAASLLILVTGYLFLGKSRGSDAPANAYRQFLEETKNKSVEYNNGSDSVQSIVLADGSEVLLEKNSRLSYAANFTSGKREVYLTGNAFFKITRNPSRPFIVYTQDIVTKVLGTSFRVKAGADEKLVIVLVKTGKVSVFRRENFSSSDAASGTLKGLVLTPNQEMVYDVAHGQMNKSLAEAPTLTRDSVFSFVFDDTPAADVFKKLQDAYGITIVADEEAMASCSISATLGNESFYEKLNIICKIINATYQVIDGNIVINAKGCR